MGSSHLARSSCTLISRAHSSLHTHGICKPLGASLHPHSVPLPPFQPCPCTLVLHTHSHTHPCNPSVQRSSQQELAGPRIHTPYSHPPLPYTPIFAQRSCTLTLLAHSTQAQPSAVCKVLRTPNSNPLLSSSFSRTCTPALTHLPSTHTSPCTLGPLHTHLGDLHAHPNVQGGRHGAASAPTPTLTPFFHARSLLHTRSCTPALAHPLSHTHFFLHTHPPNLKVQGSCDPTAHIPRSRVRPLPSCTLTHLPSPLHACRLHVSA